MKVFSATALALASLASVVLAGRDFDPKQHGGDKNKTSSFKTGAKFGDGGAQIDLSPAGNYSSGQLITLKMSRLQEIDSANSTVQQAKNFNSMGASWTDFALLTINGSDAYTSSFVATFKVADSKSNESTTSTTFNLTATIYTGNGTAMNGNQTIDVPAGALKFSVSVLSWPFANTANRLRFGVELKTRGKKGGDGAAPKKGPKSGNHTHLDRVDMGEGMFMDAPTLAVVDDQVKAIVSFVESKGPKSELVWVFPSFDTSLYYDPVLGSEDASTASTDAPTTSPSNTPSPTNGGVVAVGSLITMAFVSTTAVVFA